MIVVACNELIPLVGTTRSCALTGRSKASHYRVLSGPTHGPPAPRSTPANALSPAERERVLALLRGPAYRDLAVAQVWAILLDDGQYLCSQSTMHREPQATPRGSRSASTCRRHPSPMQSQ